MPKAPITYREGFSSEIRGSGNPPLLKTLEWNRVETELGTMVEPRQASTCIDATGKAVNVDLTDFAHNKMSLIDENTFSGQFGTGGSGMMDVNA